MRELQIFSKEKNPKFYLLRSSVRHSAFFILFCRIKISNRWKGKSISQKWNKTVLFWELFPTNRTHLFHSLPFKRTVPMEAELFNSSLQSELIRNCHTVKLLYKPGN